MQTGKDMDVTLKRFLNMVEEELSTKGIWLSEEERIKTAYLALHMFTVENYSTESAAVEDSVAHADGRMKDFEIKLVFRRGKLTADYLDGSDVEAIEIDSIDDILEKISDVIATAVEPENN